MTGFSAGRTLYSGRYFLTGDKTFSGTGNGLKIAAGAKVYIYLNGYKLTAHGANASGEIGGFAGILLPANSELIFVGNGTIDIKGGNAGNGENGGNGTAKAECKGSSVTAVSTGGTGGKGGAGAGAGIGSNGSPKGTATIGADAGKVKYYGDVSATVVGGSAGTQGQAGHRVAGVRKDYFDKGDTANTAAANYVAAGDAAKFNDVNATARYQYNYKVHDITSTMTANAVWDNAADKVTSADALWTFSDNPGHAYAVS